MGSERTVVLLQGLQANLRDRLYAWTVDSSGPTRNELNAQYDETVKMLLDLLGPSAPVGQIDSDLASFFSDLYKDVNGFRPTSGSFTYLQAKAWIDSRNSMNEDAVNAEMAEERALCQYYDELEAALDREWEMEVRKYGYPGEAYEFLDEVR